MHLPGHSGGEVLDCLPKRLPPACFGGKIA